MRKQHEVTSIDFDGDWMILAVDSQVYRLPLSQFSDRLVTASEADRNLYRIAPSGYGIHWLTLDEDLSIHGLLKLAELRSQALSCASSCPLISEPRREDNLPKLYSQDFKVSADRHPPPSEH